MRAGPAPTRAAPRHHIAARLPADRQRPSDTLCSPQAEKEVHDGSHRRPHLQEAEEVGGEHQLAPRAGDEERQVHARVQDDAQDPAQRQGTRRADRWLSRSGLPPRARRPATFAAATHPITSLTLPPPPAAQAKLVIICNNCPSIRKSEIEYYAMLSKAGVHHYTGNNVDLGTACGKLHRVSVLTITDAGDSDIIKTTTE